MVDKINKPICKNCHFTIIDLSHEFPQTLHRSCHDTAWLDKFWDGSWKRLQKCTKISHGISIVILGDLCQGWWFSTGTYYSRVMEWCITINSEIYYETLIKLRAKKKTSNTVLWTPEYCSSTTMPYHILQLKHKSFLGQFGREIFDHSPSGNELFLLAHV